MDAVEWRPVPGYEGLYDVSSDGKVWSYVSNKVLSPSHNGRGYLHCVLTKNGEKRGFGIHRLVAIAFLPNPQGKPTVNHLNEKTDDNRVENLEWATHHEQNVYGTRPQRCSEKAKKRAVIRSCPDGSNIKKYESATQAALEEKLRPENIVHCLKGRRKTCGGYQWKYQ